MPLTYSSRNSLYSIQDFLVTTGLSLAYLLLSYFLIGFKSDQVVLVMIFNVCYYASAFSRKFILGFSIFIVYWIIFDYMKAVPNYRFQEVSTAELYNFEKLLFGIHDNGRVVTPNEYFKIHHILLVDVVSGFFYLMWIPVPLAFAAFLFFKNRTQFLYFSLSFVLVNLIGFVIYYLYPAAPPWYIQQHGYEFVANTPGNTAGLARFDAYFDAPIFASIYSKSSNVFAAMPSLHSSYPVIVVYYGIRNRLGWFNAFFAIVMLGIWFTAIYTSHHYLLDVIAGISCAIIALWLFKYLIANTGLKRILDRYAKAIA